MPVLFEIFIIACGAIMKGLFIPGVTELGASSDSFPSGIVIPGANVMTLPPGEWVDLSDIDLTSSALDYRVSFSCASNHAYYSADGTIQFAAPDVWPLEYRDGMPVGRHEPEQQATNYVMHSANMVPDSFSGSPVIAPGAVVAGVQMYDVTLDTAAGGDRFLQYDTKFSTPNAQITTSFYVAGSGSDPAITATNRVMVFGNVAPYLDRRSLLNLSTGVATPFAGQESIIDGTRAISRDGLYRFSITLTTQSPVVVVKPRVMLLGDSAKNVTGQIGFLQMESGQVMSSPVLTTGGAVTRAAAFASVKNPGGQATSIRLSYSDGTTADIECPADGSDTQLPQAAVEWGSRYITRIQYARALK